MKLSNVIFYLGLFSTLSGVSGFVIWEYYSFLSLILIGVLLSFLSVKLEKPEL